MVFFLFLSLSALSGDRMGNGGDIRRYRVFRSTEFLVNVFMEQDLVPLEGPGADWLRHYAEGLRAIIENSHYAWVDRHGDSSRAGDCLNRIEAGPRVFTFEFSYESCPVRSQTNAYVDILVRSLIDAYSSTETEVADRVAAFYLAASRLQAQDEASVGKSDTRRIREPIPEPALGDVAQMGDYLRRGRAIAARQFDDIADFSLATMTDLYGRTLGPFLFANARLLADEIRNSPVSWNSDQLSCSFTDTRSHAPFELALGHCRELKSVWDLAWLVTHESVHHLGVTDEAFADAVANRLVSLGFWFETE